MVEPIGGRSRARRNLWLGFVGAGVVVAAVALPAWLLGSDGPEIAEVATTTSVVPPSESSSQPETPNETANPDEIERAVLGETLAAAREEWSAKEPDVYRLTGEIRCGGECPIELVDGPAEAMVWTSGRLGDMPDVSVLFELATGLIDSGAAGVQVEISALGYPTFIGWLGPEGPAEISVELLEVSTEFDGVWRLTSGTVGTEAIPQGDVIDLVLDLGSASFPIDCNSAGGWVSIEAGSFEMGDVVSSMVGCSTNTDRARLFVDAMNAVVAIGRAEDELILSGPDTELRFAYRGDGWTTTSGWLRSIQIDEWYRGVEVDDGYEIGPVEINLDPDGEVVLPGGVWTPDICIDLPIEGEEPKQQPCFVAAVVDARGLTRAFRVMSYRPLFDESQPSLFTETEGFSVATAERLTLEEDGLRLEVDPDVVVDCPASQEIEDLESASGHYVLELDPRTGKVIRLLCT